MRPSRARFGASFAPRALAALFVATLVAGWPLRAMAWVEAALAAHSATVALDAAGKARVTHDILLRVRGGPLDQFDIPGVDLDAAPDGEATATPVREREGNEGAEEDAGAPSVLRAEVRPGGTLRLIAREKPGLRRGSYRVRVSYRTDLLKAGALHRDGALVSLQWFGPRWPGGIDNDRCVFVTPVAPTPPRPAAEGDAEAGAGVPYQTASRRGEGGDELELVRAHVAQGERAAWRVRIDPRALAEVSDRRVVPPSPESLRALEGPSSDERRTIALVGLGLFLLVGALTALKNRQTALHAAAAGVRVRALVPVLPGDARAALAGALAACGVGLQLAWRSPLAGTVLLVAAMALMTHRAVALGGAARPPGRWLIVGEAEAFAAGPRPRDAFLDAGTLAGRVLLAFVALALVALAAWLERVAPAHAPLVLLDGLVLVPLFFTGRRGELPPSLAHATAPALRRTLRALRRAEPTPRFVPFVRFARGTGVPDELRLLAKAPPGPDGLLALEIGGTYALGLGGPALGLELLVRVRGESAAEAFLRANLPGARWSAGRAEGELVAAIEPPERGARAVADLVTTTLDVLRTAAPPSRAAVAATAPKAAQPSSASSSAGRGERASKAATSPPPPPQPTKAACSA